MKKYVYIICLSATIFSCKKSHVTEVRPYDQNYTDTTQVLLLEDKYPCMKLVTDKAVHLKVSEKKMEEHKVITNDTALDMKIRYLPLETTEECLVGGMINKLESDDSFLFIFDESNNQVLRFSQKDGSFLNKFGKKGRGPGEYVGIIDMSLNRKKKEVCLIDRFGFKFLYFDYDGQFLREEPLYYFFYNAEFVGDYMIQDANLTENTMAPSINHNRLIFAKQDHTPKYVGFSFPENFGAQFGQGMKHPFITCNEAVYYNHILSDTIWQIKENGTCEAKYVFKFPGRDNLFDEKDFQSFSGGVYAEKTNDVLYYRDEIIITEDFVQASIFNGAHLLYCIPTGHYRYGLTYYTSFGQHTLQPAKHTLNGKSFVRVLQPFDIIKEIESTKNFYNESQYQAFWNERLTEEERQLLQKMTPEDNPVLMIMDIEPF